MPQVRAGVNFGMFTDWEGGEFCSDRTSRGRNRSNARRARGPAKVDPPTLEMPPGTPGGVFFVLVTSCVEALQK